MSVTEVHSALGLDKLKNRTFQIFKVNIWNYLIHPDNILFSRQVQPRVRDWTRAWSG